MKLKTRLRCVPMHRWAAHVAMLLTASSFIFVSVGRSIAADDAGSLLKAMSDYVAGQKNLSLSYNSDIEVVTPDLQKLQFASSGQMTLSRPDKLRVRRTGGYADVEIVYDGANYTVSDVAAKVYAQLASSGTMEQLVERIRENSSIEAPGADLILSNPYAALMDGVYDARHIGPGVVDGHECEHLAFRASETDWQIWIETGSKPIPRKYVITSKGLAGAPQYTLVIKEWKTDSEPSVDQFVFKPSADMKKVDLRNLPHIDEVPPGASDKGDKK